MFGSFFCGLQGCLQFDEMQGIKTVERAVISKEEDKKTKMGKYKLLVEG